MKWWEMLVSASTLAARQADPATHQVAHDRDHLDSAARAWL